MKFADISCIVFIEISFRKSSNIPLKMKTQKGMVAPPFEAHTQGSQILGLNNILIE